MLKNAHDTKYNSGDLHELIQSSMLSMKTDQSNEKTLTVETVPNSNVLNESRLTNQQKQLLKLNSLPEIDFDIYGEFPTIKYFDVSEDDRTSNDQNNTQYTRFRRKRVLRSQDKHFLNGKQTILIRSRIHSPFNWDDKLTDSKSYIYKLLSTSYCELLLRSFHIGSRNLLKQPDCTFLQFSKGSILLNAMLNFNDVDYSLLSLQDLSKLLIEGSKELINAIIDDKNFHLGFNFNGNFSLQLTGIKEDSTVSLPTPRISPSSLPPPTVATITTTVALIHSEETDSHRRSTINEAQSSAATSDESVNTQQSTVRISSFTESLSPTEDTVTYIVALNFKVQASNDSLAWDDDLLDTNSTVYQELSQKVCEMLLTIMRSVSSLLWNIVCGTITFKKGSIAVVAELILTMNSTSYVTTYEPISTVLNETSLFEAVNDYITTVNLNSTFGIYIDPDSSISLTCKSLDKVSK
ncbi:hypothetical protein MN116_005093 [Schistosoma mekongi]|uniref:SEA domain-containing protein n=1 Tax=Schistosoma mekongi TaxID=38744 RepID=A0AAE1ZDZ1_SCHME|nr:hypothetical protein MN116_005093 [Schistosoma mekongi]